MLSPETIAEFRTIIKDEFGIEMTEAEAAQRAHEVLEFFWLLYREREPSVDRGQLD